MPIIRKLIAFGDSKAVTLPKSWVKSAEEEAGKKIIALAMEVNHIITVAPVFEKKEAATE